MSQFASPSNAFSPFGVWTAIFLWTLSGLAAGVVLARAIEGSFDEAVHGVIPGLAATTGLVACLLAWQVHVVSVEVITPTQRLTIGLGSLVPPCVIGYSTSVHASPISLGVTTGILLIGLVAVIIDSALSASIARTNVHPLVDNDSSFRGSPKGRVAGPVSIAGERSDAYREIATHLAPQNEQKFQTQQFTRSRDTSGSEIIEATLRATFRPGEKVVALHLPFHPILLGTVEAECEPLDDSDVTVAITTVQPYGMRIEARRTQGLSDELTIPVGVAVSSSRQTANVA